MRQHGFWLGLTMVLALRTTAPAADFAWLEGEEPSSSNYHKYDVTSWAGHPYLSAGKWLRIQVPAGDAAKVVPNEGIVLGYDFLAPSAGKYEVWNRIGYEFVRSPFSWRIDNGPWQEVLPSNLTIDLMLLTDWNELAWCKCGLANLSQGKHRLEIRLQRWFKTANKSKEEQQIFYCSDALCISQGPFRPNGKFKPGAAYQDERDEAAAKQVFQMGRGRETRPNKGGGVGRPAPSRGGGVGRPAPNKGGGVGRPVPNKGPAQNRGRPVPIRAAASPGTACKRRSPACGRSPAGTN